MAARRTDSRIWATLLALSLTVVGASKPFTIDETVYHLYAHQILEDPLDPLGFEVLWTDVYEPALEVLAPPGMLYWMAAGLALFGDQPWLLKLWLFPYALLFCFALRALLVRFAPGSGTPLLFAIALSPAIVPAFNLMLDIPALALGLGALAIFIGERAARSSAISFVAGAMAGLGILTKYTALGPLLALLLFGLRERRWKHAAIAGGAAAALFLAWEAWLFHLYGDSQFIHALLRPPEPQWVLSPGEAVVGWLALFGGLGLPVLLLSFVSFGVRPPWLLLALLLASAPFAWIGLLDPRPGTILLNPPRLDIGDAELNIFFATGLLVVPIAAGGVAVGVRRASGEQRRDARFLAAWVAIELLCTLAMAPYLAGRRVIGTLVAASVALGAASAQRADSAASLRWVAAWTVALGLLFGTADQLDAQARKSAQDVIAAKLEDLGFDPSVDRVWFVGHWGFRFYAERRGYQPLVAGVSVLREGDFVLNVAGVHRQRLPTAFGKAISPPLAQVQTMSSFPWSTTPSAYLGSVPLRRQPRAQLRIRIHRVLRSGRLPPLQ